MTEDERDLQRTIDANVRHRGFGTAWPMPEKHRRRRGR